MSILANLLKKTEPNQAKAEIPPGVLQAVSSSNAAPARRSYYLLGGLALAAVVAGILLGIYLNHRPAPARPLASPPPQPVVALQAPLSSVRPEPSPVPVVATEPPAVAEAVVKPPSRRPRLVQSVKRSLPAPVPQAPALPVAPEQKVVVPKDRTIIDAHLFVARNAEARRDYLTALKQYRLALDADPDNYRIMNNVASTMLQLGMYDEALLVSGRALAVKPDYVSAIINAGIAQGNLGNGGASRGMFAKAVTLDPSNRSALYNLALSQERAGTLDDALKTYRRLADGGDPQGYLGQGRLWERQGNKQEALRLYRELTVLSEVGQRAKEQARERIKVLERQ